MSDIQRAAKVSEGKLGLQALRSGPSARIADGSRVSTAEVAARRCNLYQSVTAGAVACDNGDLVCRRHRTGC